MAYSTRSNTMKLQRLIEFLKDRGSGIASSLETSASMLFDDVKPKSKPPAHLLELYNDVSDDGSSYCGDDESWGSDWEEDLGDDEPPSPEIIPQPTTPEISTTTEQVKQATPPPLVVLQPMTTLESSSLPVVVERAPLVLDEVPQVTPMVTVEEKVTPVVETKPAVEVEHRPDCPLHEAVIENSKSKESDQSKMRAKAYLSGFESSKEVPTPLMKFSTHHVSIPDSFVSQQDKSSKVVHKTTSDRNKKKLRLDVKPKAKHGGDTTEGLNAAPVTQASVLENPMTSKNEQKQSVTEEQKDNTRKSNDKSDRTEQQLSMTSQRIHMKDPTLKTDTESCKNTQPRLQGENISSVQCQNDQNITPQTQSPALPRFANTEPELKTALAPEISLKAEQLPLRSKTDVNAENATYIKENSALKADEKIKQDLKVETAVVPQGSPKVPKAAKHIVKASMNNVEVSIVPPNVADASSVSQNVIEFSRVPTNAIEVARNNEEASKAPTNILEVSKAATNIIEVSKTPTNILEVSEASTNIVEVPKTPKNVEEVFKSTTNEVAKVPKNGVEAAKVPKNVVEAAKVPKNVVEAVKVSNAIIQDAKVSANDSKGSQNPEEVLRVPQSVADTLNVVQKNPDVAKVFQINTKVPENDTSKVSQNNSPSSKHVHFSENKSGSDSENKIQASTIPERRPPTRKSASPVTPLTPTYQVPEGVSIPKVGGQRSKKPTLASQWRKQKVRQRKAEQFLLERVETFATWPTGSDEEAAEKLAVRLAEAGFIFLGLNDSVQCAACNLVLNDWSPDDDPWLRHALESPTCNFLDEVRGSDWVQAQLGQKL